MTDINQTSAPFNDPSGTGAADRGTFRFAVVGLGQISQQAFVPAIRSLPDAEITAVVTGSEEKAGAVSDDVAVYDYDEFPQLLERGDIDGIYVATPVFRHREFAEPALEAGI
ncbi:MAG TPA: Gfo/Idh/MocA family oxidoreductase, partial [Corynebacterium sp.]|uniref:Gfo/Idh/MocA family protein n=1 Tax=Corynebacterium sp. TaxID=1720 RepID=UPI001821F69E